MIGHVEPATHKHAERMAAHLRPGDADEMAALWNGDPAAGLRMCIDLSVRAWAWIVDGEVACLWGIGVGSGSIIGDVGYPWLMSTEMVERHRFSFLRQYKPYLAEMLTMFPHLVNWCDGRYAMSHRWLKWMGFKLDDPAPYGPRGVPFRRFTMEA